MNAIDAILKLAQTLLIVCGRSSYPLSNWIYGIQRRRQRHHRELGYAKFFSAQMADAQWGDKGEYGEGWRAVYRAKMADQGWITCPGRPCVCDDLDGVWRRNRSWIGKLAHLAKCRRTLLANVLDTRPKMPTSGRAE